MSGRVVLALWLAALALPVQAAPPSRPPRVANARSLVHPSAPWRWQSIVVSRSAGGEPAPAANAPAGWPWALASESAAIAAASEATRVAAAFGLTTFTLAEADQGLHVLELRVRYRDGIAVWLNGIEVARRALQPRGSPIAPALRPHGPEWETFYIPVAPAMLRLGRNILAIELRPSKRRDAPTVIADLIGRRDLGITRGPILTDRTATTAAITVLTDPAVEARIEWGTGTLDHSAISPPGDRHQFVLTDLPARGRTTYRVTAGATSTARHAVIAPPSAGDVVRIGVYGDVRGGHAIHQQIVRAMVDEPLDLVAVTGDMVLRGSDRADWQRFFTITAPLLARVRYLPAIGNHDLGDDDRALALPAGPPDRPDGMFWYSYDLADVHLVFLDSNAYASEAQVTWLERDLGAARQRNVRAIIAFTHDGPYSRGPHRGNELARTRFVPILTRHRVTLVLSGHDHLYQRGSVGGLAYVVTGGGGAPLYSIACGVRGRPSCAVDDGMQATAKEHHYVILTIGKRWLEMCARRITGQLLEPCQRYPL
ncbi:MAG: metallophosphoesterase [Kofleriaceae bacterium]